MKDFPQRYILVILSFFGMFCMYMTRININIAIIGMSSSKKASLIEGKGFRHSLNFCRKHLRVVLKIFEDVNVNNTCRRFEEGEIPKASEISTEFDWSNARQGALVGERFKKSSFQSYLAYKEGQYFQF